MPGASSRKILKPIFQSCAGGQSLNSRMEKVSHSLAVTFYKTDFRRVGNWNYTRLFELRAERVKRERGRTDFSLD